jgi:membrane-associated phospholipid phosphatase
MEKSIYQIISLSEFAALTGILAVAITSRNLFLAVIGFFLILKQLPEKLLKSNIKGTLSKRPDNAKNCNMINKGGESKTPGFPSGHSTIASFLFFVILLEFVRVKKIYKVNLYELLLLGLVLLLAVPYSRVKLGCHTTEQVLGGVVLGFIVFLIFVLFEKHVLLKNKRYVKDKLRVYDYFVDGFRNK